MIDTHDSRGWGGCTNNEDEKQFEQSRKCSHMALLVLHPQHSVMEGLLDAPGNTNWARTLRYDNALGQLASRNIATWVCRAIARNRKSSIAGNLKEITDFLMVARR